MGSATAASHRAALPVVAALAGRILRPFVSARTWLAVAYLPGAVEKHISGIFAKLGLPPTDTENRRVLAVLAYLGA